MGNSSVSKRKYIYLYLSIYISLQFQFWCLLRLYSDPYLLPRLAMFQVFNNETAVCNRDILKIKVPCNRVLHPLVQN